MENICNILGFQRVQNLEKYLGVPLFHNRVIISTLRFVVYKVRSRLQNWDVKKLLLVRRATLAQSVLMSIRNSFM